MGGHLFSPRFCPDLSVIHPCLGVETPVGGTTVPTSTTTKRYTRHALVVLKTSPPATRRSKVPWMLGFRMPRPSFGGSDRAAPGRFGTLRTFRDVFTRFPCKSSYRVIGVSGRRATEPVTCRRRPAALGAPATRTPPRRAVDRKSTRL